MHPHVFFPPLHVQTSNISDSIIPVSGSDRKVGLGQEQETETGIVASGYSVTTSLSPAERDKKNHSFIILLFKIKRWKIHFNNYLRGGCSNYVVS